MHVFDHQSHSLILFSFPCVNIKYICVCICEDFFFVSDCACWVLCASEDPVKIGSDWAEKTARCLPLVEFNGRMWLIAGERSLEGLSGARCVVMSVVVRLL